MQKDPRRIKVLTDCLVSDCFTLLVEVPQISFLAKRELKDLHSIR